MYIYFSAKPKVSFENSLSPPSLLFSLREKLKNIDEVESTNLKKKKKIPYTSTV